MSEYLDQIRKEHPVSIERLFRPKDRAFYENLLEYARENDISFQKSDVDVFSICSQISLKEIEKIEGYSQIDLIRAFLIGFYQWVWEYCEERDFPFRRVWYLKFKQFCINIYSEDYAEKQRTGELSDKKDFDRYYSQKLSDTLADMIDKNASYSKLLYKDFSISDISRLAWTKSAYAWKNVFLCGEKDASTPYFEELSSILGIRKLYSQKGKSAKAAVEKLFLSGDLKPNLPIVCLTMSDFDWDGINGVESGVIKHVKFYAEMFGFKSQFKRVGVNPEDIPESDRNPMGKCYRMKRQSMAWTKEHGIKWINKAGKTEYLGIEMEALPIRFYRNKILKTLIDCGFEFQEWSDWSRNQHTPDEYEYDSTREDLAEDYADRTEESFEINAKIRALESELDSLKERRDEIVEKFKELLEEEQESLLSRANWDDRQREWDEKANDWTSDSIDEMVENHQKAIEISVDIEQRFVDYWECLGFKKSQLTNKLKEALKEYLEENHSNEFLAKGEEPEDIEYKIEYEEIDE